MGELSRPRWEAVKTFGGRVRSWLLTFGALKVAVPLLVAVVTVLLEVFRGAPLAHIIMVFLGVFVLVLMIIEHAIVRPWRWLFPREGVSGISEAAVDTESSPSNYPKATDEDLQADLIVEKTLNLLDVINDQGMISDKSFVRCDIHGPAIIRPAERRPFHNCHWFHLPLNQREEMFYHDRAGVAYGTCRTTNTSFSDCNFHRIAFMLKPSEIKAIWSGYNEDVEAL